MRNATRSSLVLLVLRDGDEPGSFYVIDIPERMQGLPLFHGLPIPYAVFVGEDGIPDFKVADEKKRTACLLAELCSLCGQRLEPMIVFIGGPKCVVNRLFFDPPMHKTCAVYATKVCPYLSNAQHDYAKQPPRHLLEGQTVIKVHEEIDGHRPDRLAVYYCRSYEMVRFKSVWYAKAGKPFAVDWNLCARNDKPAVKPVEE